MTAPCPTAFAFDYHAEALDWFVEERRRRARETGSAEDGDAGGSAEERDDRIRDGAATDCGPVSRPPPPLPPPGPSRPPHGPSSPEAWLRASALQHTSSQPLGAAEPLPAVRPSASAIASAAEFCGADAPARSCEAEASSGIPGVDEEPLPPTRVVGMRRAGSGPANDGRAAATRFPAESVRDAAAAAAAASRTENETEVHAGRGETRRHPAPAIVAISGRGAAAQPPSPVASSTSLAARDPLRTARTPPIAVARPRVLVEAWVVRQRQRWQRRRLWLHPWDVRRDAEIRRACRRTGRLAPPPVLVPVPVRPFIAGGPRDDVVVVAVWRQLAVDGGQPSPPASPVLAPASGSVVTTSMPCKSFVLDFFAAGGAAAVVVLRARDEEPDPDVMTPSFTPETWWHFHPSLPLLCEKGELSVSESDASPPCSDARILEEEDSLPPFASAEPVAPDFLYGTTSSDESQRRPPPPIQSPDGSECSAEAAPGWSSPGNRDGKGEGEDGCGNAASSHNGTHRSTTTPVGTPAPSRRTYAAVDRATPQRPHSQSMSIGSESASMERVESRPTLASNSQEPRVEHSITAGGAPTSSPAICRERVGLTSSPADAASALCSHRPEVEVPAAVLPDQLNSTRGADANEDAANGRPDIPIEDRRAMKKKRRKEKKRKREHRRHEDYEARNRRKVEAKSFSPAAASASAAPTTPSATSVPQIHCTDRFITTRPGSAARLSPVLPLDADASPEPAKLNVSALIAGRKIAAVGKAKENGFPAEPEGTTRTVPPTHPSNGVQSACRELPGHGLVTPAWNLPPLMSPKSARPPAPGAGFSNTYRPPQDEALAGTPASRAPLPLVWGFTRHSHSKVQLETAGEHDIVEEIISPHEGGAMLGTASFAIPPESSSYSMSECVLTAGCAASPDNATGSGFLNGSDPLMNPYHDPVLSDGHKHILALDAARQPPSSVELQNVSQGASAPHLQSPCSQFSSGPPCNLRCRPSTFQPSLGRQGSGSLNNQGVPEKPRPESSAPSVQVLCSEGFLDTWGDMASELGSGRWAAFQEDSTSSRLDGRPIELVDTCLVDRCDVDIELPHRRAVIVYSVSALETADDAKQIILSVARSVASGRYRRLIIIVCYDVPVTDAIARHVVQLNCCALCNGFALPTSTFVKTASPQTLSAVIASTILASTSSVSRFHSSLLETARQPRILKWALFLMAFSPKLCAAGALQCLGLSHERSAASPWNALSFLLQNERVRRDISEAARSNSPLASAIHPDALDTLTTALHAPLSERVG